MRVADAAVKSRLEALVALRDVLAERVDDAPPTILPQIAAQFRSTLAEIESLSPSSAKKETGLSDFEKRLRERESGSKTKGRAKSG